jgi:hypothetical protein
MTRVVPSGSPYWSRTNTFAHYGGSASKSDYAGIPALGGDTDLAAEDFNRGPTDLAACSRSQVFCVLQLDGSTDPPSVNYAALPTGVYLGEPYPGDNPPSGFPVVVRTASGYTVTVADSYLDSYGIEQTVSITGARVTVASLTIGEAATAEKSSDTELAIEAFDENGTALSGETLTMEIW